MQVIVEKGKTKPVTIGDMEIVDKNSGEVTSCTVIDKAISKDYNFHKIWLQDILHVLDNFGSKKIKILTYLLGEMRNEDNTISVNYRYISSETGISYGTVATTMKELAEGDVIKKIRQGTYQFNPSLIIKGGHEKRQNLLIRYNYGDDNQTMKLDEEKKQIENIAKKISSEPSDDIIEVEEVETVKSPKTLDELFSTPAFMEDDSEIVNATQNSQIRELAYGDIKE